MTKQQQDRIREIDNELARIELAPMFECHPDDEREYDRLVEERREILRESK